MSSSSCLLQPTHRAMWKPDFQLELINVLTLHGRLASLIGKCRGTEKEGVLRAMWEITSTTKGREKVEPEGTYPVTGNRLGRNRYLDPDKI